jgi:dihydroorotate dehydrogenase (fumarate)
MSVDMKDLSTQYLGLSLKNPVVVGSSGLTDSTDKIIKLAESNAGAVVLKSLFEEQILAELSQNLTTYNADYPDAFDYIREYTRENSVAAYLDLISEAKKAVEIPVIASINCVSGNEWIAFAKSVENAGADALEINISLLPSDPRRKCDDYEKLYFDVVEKVASLISIPIALKMSRYSSALSNLVTRLSWTGKVAGFVLFNRYFRPDFDIESLTVHSANVFSTPEEIFTSLRWIALLSGNVERDFAASTGIHDSASIIKQLLAGASAVQVVSALYKNSPSYINVLLKGLEDWMESKSYDRISDFKGKLSVSRTDDSAVLHRIQYMKYFGGIS